MTLRHLTIFVAVCKYMSFTKAAKSLFISQPAVSLAISELENYYGVVLFDRMAKKIMITASGERLHDYAIHIVSLFNEMEESVQHWSETSKINIGSSMTIGTKLLPKLMKEFTSLYPVIETHVTINNTDQIIQQILENKLDIALVEGHVSSTQLKHIPFVEDRLCLVCGKTHPLALIKQIKVLELEKQEFLLRETGSAGRDIFDGLLAMYEIEIHPIWESTSTEAIIEALKSGLGISILPYLLVEKEILSGDIVELECDDMTLTRYFSIIYHKNKRLSQSMETFIEFCQQNKMNF